MALLLENRGQSTALEKNALTLGNSGSALGTVPGFSRHENKPNQTQFFGFLWRTPLACRVANRRDAWSPKNRGQSTALERMR
jgi:hypothetical protein